MSDTSDSLRNGLTYADAGVDIDAGEILVDAIKPLAKSTRRPGAEASLGGFGALFDLKAAGFEDPLIVATTDGVGTKLKIAIETGRHDGVGIDLVAMCVPSRCCSSTITLPASSRSTPPGASWPESPRAAVRPAALSSVARPPKCRACTKAVTMIWRAFRWAP